MRAVRFRGRMRSPAPLPLSSHSEAFLGIDRMSGWELAGLGLIVTLLVLGLSYVIALLWQRWRDPRRS